MTRPRRPFAYWLSTVFGLGFLPLAPGTWGSLPGLLLGVGLHHLGALGALNFATSPSEWWIWSAGLTFALLVLCGLIAFWAIARTEPTWLPHDSKHIVIDETVAQAMVVAFLPPSPKLLLVGFVAFRLLDALKPWPISWLDRELPGAYGTLLDDIAAAAVALVFLFVFGNFIF